MDFFSKPPHTAAKPTLALLRFDGIGDYLMMRPFLPYLRRSKKYAHYQMILVGRNNFAPLALAYDHAYFDKIYWMNPWNILKSGLLIRKLNRHAITELVSPVGYLDPYFITPFFTHVHAQHKIAASFKSPRSPKAGQRYQQAATRIIRTAPNALFEFDRYKSFFEQLIEEPIDLDIAQVRLPATSNLPAPYPEKYALLAPHTSTQARNLSPEVTIKIAQHILSAYPLKHLFLLGNNTALKKIADSIGSAQVHIYHAPSICDTIPFVQQASLIVTADTCFLHLGAQLGIKTLYLAGNHSYGLFHPYPAHFTHVKGIYPPNMLENIGKLDPLIQEPKYNVNQIPLDYIFEEMDKFFDH